MNSIYNRTRSHNELLSNIHDRLKNFRQDLIGTKEPTNATPFSPPPPPAPAPANFEAMMHSEFDHTEMLINQLELEINRLSEFFHKPDGAQLAKANY